MTVAIAAVVPGGEHIVTVSDTRFSFNDLMPAAERHLKTRKVAKNWGLLFSADNTDTFLPVHGEIHRLTQYNPDDQPEVSFLDMRNFCEAAYQTEFYRQFVGRHLVQWGYKNIEQFRSTARSEITDKKFDEILGLMMHFDIGLNLLVYGFDRGGMAHLFEVRNPGRVDNKDLVGYAAIGSGSHLAMSELNRRGKVAGLAETIYGCMGAKFASESANAVGDETATIIMSKDGSTEIIQPRQAEEVRKVWRRELDRADPDDALEIINSARKPFNRGPTASDDEEESAS